MSKCDLSIDVEKNQVRLGEEIRGAVHVSVNKDCKLKHLSVALAYQTQSRASTVKGGPPAVVLKEGELKAGEIQSHPFAIPVPAGPCSYQGSLLSIHWSLKARADIPWAIDPKADTAIEVVPAPCASYQAGPTFVTPVMPKIPKDGLALGVILGIFFILAVVSGIVIFEPAQYQAWLWAIPPAIFVVGGGLFSIGRSRRLLAKKKLGEPEVRIEPLLACPGGPVEISLDLKPRAPLTINAIALELKAFERIVYSETYYSGGKTRTRRVVKTQPITTLNPEMVFDKEALAAGHPAVARAKVTLPPTAPLTFSAKDNEIRWQLKLHIDIAGWPDWKREFPFAVLPPGR